MGIVVGVVVAVDVVVVERHYLMSADNLSLLYCILLQQQQRFYITRKIKLGRKNIVSENRRTVLK